MDEKATVRRAVRLLEAELDSELIALDVDRGACYGFNATATRVWALIEQPKRLSEIRDALLGEYEIDEETCLSDLAGLVEILAAKGLVEIEAAAA